MDRRPEQPTDMEVSRGFSGKIPLPCHVCSASFHFLKLVTPSVYRTTLVFKRGRRRLGSLFCACACDVLDSVHSPSGSNKKITPTEVE